MTPQIRLGLALAALGYLLLMFAVGSAPERQHFHRPADRGVLRVPGTEVTRIELRVKTRTHRVMRRGGRWWHAERELSNAAAAKVDRALNLLATSAPVRTLSPAATQHSTYGLDPPAYALSLSNDAGTLLQMALGAASPDGILRYAQTADSTQVMLVSGFIGTAWEEVAAALNEP